MPDNTTSAVRSVGLILAFALLVISLGCSTLLYAEDSTFLLGIICLLFGIGHLAWYANPFIFLSGLFLLLEKPRWALGASIIATTLALTTFSIEQIERNEAGTMAPVIGYGAGFYLWLACTIVLLATSMFVTVVEDHGRSAMARQGQ